MTDAPVGPGTVLAGRFVLEDLVDETEGARLWRATDQILARNVAVHVIASSDPRAAALLNAARTSATVADGHLLRVLDAATEDDFTYVVNEWGHGVSLDRLLAEGPLTPRRAAWVAKEVAEAISTAHRHGIAHGRLLPENVMVTESGAVKLIGFVVDAVLRGQVVPRVTGGPALGEHEADVVNLGALLYAGLVGRWPGTEGSQVPAAPVEHDRPMRPRQVRAGVPRPLDAICERVLNADGNNHTLPLGTAHEVYAALCDYIGDPSVTPTVGEATGVMGPLALQDLDDTGHPPATDGAGPTRLFPEPATQRGDTDTAGLPQVGAAAAVPPTVAEDPERTQAGVPVFDDPSGHRDAEPTRVVPPPPPFTDPEPRPLFASDEPRRPREPEPSYQQTRTTGHGTLPPVWGPDADTPPPAGGRHRDEWDDEPPGRSWLRLAAALAGVLVLVLAIVFAFNLGRGSITPEEESAPETTKGATRETPKPVDITAVSDFDPPPGDGEENPETAPLAIDGNETTAWQTSTYYDPLSLQKPGVGLVVDLGRSVPVSDVRLTLLGSGTDVELRAATDVTTAPTALEQTRRIAGQTGAGTSVTLDPPRPVETRYLLVWLTDLPPVSGGFRGQVAEISVRS